MSPRALGRMHLTAAAAPGPPTFRTPAGRACRQRVWRGGSRCCITSRRCHRSVTISQVCAPAGCLLFAALPPAALPPAALVWAALGQGQVLAATHAGVLGGSCPTNILHPSLHPRCSLIAFPLHPHCKEPDSLHCPIASNCVQPRCTRRKTRVSFLLLRNRWLPSATCWWMSAHCRGQQELPSSRRGQQRCSSSRRRQRRCRQRCAACRRHRSSWLGS